MIDAESVEPLFLPRTEFGVNGHPGRRLSRDTVMFGLGALAGKAIALLALPIFARLLTPEEFGRLDVLNTLVSAGIVTLLLGTDVAATRLYFDRHPPHDQKQLLSSWYVLGGAVMAPAALVLILAAEPVSRILFGSAAQTSAMMLTGIAMVAGTIWLTTLGVLRTTGRPRDYALLEGGALVVNAALAVVLLVLWRSDVAAVMLALAISWSGSAVIGVVWVRHSITARPAMSAAGALLRLGLPLAPAVAATWGAEFFNRAFLIGIAGATQAGYLSIAVRIASVAALVVVATQLAWHPHAFRLGSSPGTRVQLALEGRQILVALSISVAILGVLSPEIVAVIGAGRYADARPVVGICLIGILATGVFTVASLPSAMARATPDIGAAVLAGVGVGVVLNLVLAAVFGAVGTATAIATGQIVTAGVAFVLGRRHEPMPVAWGRVGAVIALAVAVVVVSTLAPDASIALRLTLAVTFAVALMLEGTLVASLVEGRHRARHQD